MIQIPTNYKNIKVKLPSLKIELYPIKQGTKTNVGTFTDNTVTDDENNNFKLATYISSNDSTTNKGIYRFDKYNENEGTTNETFKDTLIINGSFVLQLKDDSLKNMYQSDFIPLDSNQSTNNLTQFTNISTIIIEKDIKSIEFNNPNYYFPNLKNIIVHDGVKYFQLLNENLNKNPETLEFDNIILPESLDFCIFNLTNTTCIVQNLIIKGYRTLYLGLKNITIYKFKCHRIIDRFSDVPVYTDHTEDKITIKDSISISSQFLSLEPNLFYDDNTINFEVVENNMNDLNFIFKYIYTGRANLLIKDPKNETNIKELFVSEYPMDDVYKQIYNCFHLNVDTYYFKYLIDRINCPIKEYKSLTIFYCYPTHYSGTFTYGSLFNDYTNIFQFKNSKLYRVYSLNVDTGISELYGTYNYVVNETEKTVNNDLWGFDINHNKARCVVTNDVEHAENGKVLKIYLYSRLQEQESKRAYGYFEYLDDHNFNIKRTNMSSIVKNKVDDDGNIIEWQIGNGILRQYTYANGFITKEGSFGHTGSYNYEYKNNRITKLNHINDSGVETGVKINCEYNQNNNLSKAVIKDAGKSREHDRTMTYEYYDNQNLKQCNIYSIDRGKSDTEWIETLTTYTKYFYNDNDDIVKYENYTLINNAFVCTEYCILTNSNERNFISKYENYYDYKAETGQYNNKRIVNFTYDPETYKFTRSVENYTYDSTKGSYVLSQ